MASATSSPGARSRTTNLTTHGRPSCASRSCKRTSSRLSRTQSIMKRLEWASVSSSPSRLTGLIGSKYVWNVCRESRPFRRWIARVQRSVAVRSDSREFATAEPSTVLFTAVDKEPGIGSPPGFVLGIGRPSSARRGSLAVDVGSPECLPDNKNETAPRTLANGAKADQARSPKWLDRRRINGCRGPNRLRSERSVVRRGRSLTCAVAHAFVPRFSLSGGSPS